MAKLTCRISYKLADAVDRYQIEYDVNKSDALKALIELAIEKPDYPIPDVSAEEKVNCTISLDDADFLRYKFYRMQHKLVPKVAFFKHALVRGIVIYLTSDGQGDLDLKGGYHE
jgi:hypothetical protein